MFQCPQSTLACFSASQDPYYAVSSEKSAMCFRGSVTLDAKSVSNLKPNTMLLKKKDIVNKHCVCTLSPFMR